MSVRKPMKHEESREQQHLFQWAGLMSKSQAPELALMFHIPNGQKLSGTHQQRMIKGVRLKAEGLKAGVPDICLPVARSGYHGMFIELKKASGGTLSKEQRQWINDLLEQGYWAIRCNGFEEAKAEIEEYLKGGF